MAILHKRQNPNPQQECQTEHPDTQTVTAAISDGNKGQNSSNAGDGPQEEPLRCVLEENRPGSGTGEEESRLLWISQEERDFVG